MSGADLIANILEFKHILSASLDEYKKELTDPDYHESNLDFAIHTIAYAKAVDFCVRKYETLKIRPKVYWQTRFEEFTDVTWDGAVNLAAVGAVILYWPEFSSAKTDITVLEDVKSTMFRRAFGFRGSENRIERFQNSAFVKNMGMGTPVKGSTEIVNRVRDMVDPPCDGCKCYKPTSLCTVCEVVFHCSRECAKGHAAECAEIKI